MGTGQDRQWLSHVAWSGPPCGPHQSGRLIDKELDALGIIARARGHKGLAEEQPAAYKDVDQVVEVVAKAGISKKVARLRLVGVIKG